MKLNFRFERIELLRTKLNWKLMKLNEEVTKWAGKSIIYTPNGSIDVGGGN